MAGSDRRELVGVFADRAQAESVADRLRAAGVPDEQISIDEGADREASLRGEMREELERSLVSPQAGVVLTKRAVKGILATSPVTIVVGVLIALPFAFMSWGSLPLVGRIVAAVLVGAAAGATVGFVVGGGEAEKGAPSAMAAEQGVTLRVADARPEVKRALTEADPIRVDVVDPDGAPLGPLTSKQDDDENVVEDLERAWREPERDPGDEPRKTAGR